MHGIEAQIILNKQDLDKGNAGAESTFTTNKIDDANVININNLVKKKPKTNLPENNKELNLQSAKEEDISKRTMKDFCPEDDDIKVEKINKTN